MRPNELNRKAIKRTYGNTRNETIRSRILKYLKGCDTIALPQGKKYNAEDITITLGYGYDNPVYVIECSVGRILLDYDTLHEVYYLKEGDI
mgnify:CR=1 FL=1